MRLFRRVSATRFELELEAGESVTISGVPPLIEEGVVFDAIQAAIEGGPPPPPRRPAWQIVHARSRRLAGYRTVLTVELVRW